MTSDNSSLDIGGPYGSCSCTRKCRAVLVLNTGIVFLISGAGAFGKLFQSINITSSSAESKISSGILLTIRTCDMVDIRSDEFSFLAWCYVNFSSFVHEIPVIINYQVIRLPFMLVI